MLKFSLFCIDKRNIPRYNVPTTFHFIVPEMENMAKRKDPNAPQWEQLPKRLLSPEGCEIVSRDPNLSASTLKTLNKTEKPYLEGNLAESHEWYFDIREDGSDISAVLLASCINDNVNACMAEIVARYAGVRRLSFLEVANKLCELRREGRLYRLSSDMPHRYIKWQPAIVEKESARPPAKKKKSRGTKASYTAAENL